MIQIRESVFETNSSSMHSLVIKNNNVFKTDESFYITTEDIKEEFYRLVGKDGVLRTYDDDWYFGRTPFRILSSFIDKMKYAFANGFEYDEILSIVQKYDKTVTAIKIPNFCGTDECSLDGWMKIAEINLEEFLTNKKYVVICDGDEYCIWEDLKKSGLIDSKSYSEV